MARLVCVKFKHLGSGLLGCCESVVARNGGGSDVGHGRKNFHHSGTNKVVQDDDKIPAEILKAKDREREVNN